VELISNPLKNREPTNPAYHEGKNAYYNGLELTDNPYKEADKELALLWDSGWNKAFKARQKFEKNNTSFMERVLKNYDPFEPHPLWHVVLFIGLFVIFFPWSLLLLLLIFGWDGSVQIFRGLVIGTLGIAAFILWLAIVLVIVAVVIALLVGDVLTGPS